MNGVRLARISMGEAVVVFGLGLLGQLCIQLVRFHGARPVIGVDLSPYRREIAEKCGTSYTFEKIEEELISNIALLTKRRMIDIVFEITGNPKIIPEEFKVLHQQGRFIVLSSPRGKTEFDFHDLVNSPSHTIIGAHNRSHPPVETYCNPWTKERNVEFFFELIKAKEIEVSPLISHRFAWKEIEKAYNLLMEKRES